MSSSRRGGNNFVGGSTSRVAWVRLARFGVCTARGLLFGLRFFDGNSFFFEREREKKKERKEVESKERETHKKKTIIIREQRQQNSSSGGVC